jgi:hypothetical protein
VIDPTLRSSGESVTITVTADCKAEIAELNETNNATSILVTVIERPPDTEPPEVTNPVADPSAIPEDTDNEPLWGELANLSVTVTDASAITSVTLDLSAVGGSGTQPMTRIGASDQWYVVTNASVGSAVWGGSAYVPRLLQVTATDEHGYSNTSVSIAIALLVMKNGDVDESGVVNLEDAIYLANYALLVPGFDLVPGVAEVDGIDLVNLEDAIYLANHGLMVPGYEILH